MYGAGGYGHIPITSKNAVMVERQWCLWFCLKLKVIGAIVAISAIELLKTFVNIPSNPTPAEIDVLKWKVIIHMAFVISGVMFALMDRISSGTSKH